MQSLQASRVLVRVMCAASLIAVLGVFIYRYSKGPVIAVNSLSYDFGEVDPGQTLTHVFRISNAGTAVLVVGKVRSTCDCTESHLSRVVFQPGDFGDLKVSLKMREGTYSQVARVMIESNDAAKPQLALELSARSSPVFELRPPHIMLGDVPAAGVRANHVVYCRDEDAIHLSVDDVLEPSPVSVQYVRSEGERPSVSVKVNPDAPIGPITARLKVRIAAASEDGQDVIRTVPIRGNVVGGVSAVPSELNVGVISPPEHRSRQGFATGRGRTVLP